MVTMDNKAVFQSIEEAKRRSTFFRQGAIVPNWVAKIVKGQRRKKHNFVFACPTWVFNTGYGPLIISDSRGGGSYRLKPGTDNIHIQFNPYAPGDSLTVANGFHTDDEWLYSINQCASEMMSRRSHEQSA